MGGWNQSWHQGTIQSRPSKSEKWKDANRLSSLIKCSVINSRRARKGKCSFVSTLDKAGSFIICCHQIKYQMNEQYLLGLKHTSLSTEKIHLSHLIQSLLLKKRQLKGHCQDILAQWLIHLDSSCSTWKIQPPREQELSFATSCHTFHSHMLELWMSVNKPLCS